MQNILRKVLKNTMQTSSFASTLIIAKYYHEKVNVIEDIKHGPTIESAVAITSCLVFICEYYWGNSMLFEFNIIN